MQTVTTIGFVSPSQFVITERPPSTISVASVMNEASSLASQMIGQAISSGAAQRAKSDVVCRSVLSCSMLLPAACARRRYSE